RITRGTIRISQSKVPSPGADETTFTTGDVRYREALLTDTSLDTSQDKENITKTSAITHEALPKVTSLGGGEGSMQQKLKELMDICTSLQRQHSLIEERIQSQDLEITQLKTKEDLLDRDKSTDKGSDSTYEMSHALGSLRAANILASRGMRLVFTTSSLSVATASTDISPIVATTSGSFPTAAIFTIASVATPTTRVTRSSRGVVIRSSSLISINIPSISKKDKGKRKMTELEQPSKEKVLEQSNVQLVRDLEAKFAQKDLIIREQAKRDPEIARIHAEKELKMIIAELDRSNEMVVKYLNLGLIPCEFEDTSGSESACILPSCDDFSPIYIPEEKGMTFSNPLFNSNDDFISSDDESLSDEDVLEDNVKIYSNPFYEFVDEYISSDVNPVFDEVLENIKSKDSYDSNIDESDLLVAPFFDAIEDECFDSGGDVDEINDFEDGYYDSEGDILYLESLLSDDTTLISLLRCFKIET
nr:hypothetical protein [Tanacetum cinerariifolium]